MIDHNCAVVYVARYRAGFNQGTQSNNMEWNIFNALFGLGMKPKVQPKQEQPPQEEPATTNVLQSDDPDIKKIADYVGGELNDGMVVDITLHDILSLIPPANPNRRRRDSYDKLVRKLRGLGVELRIDSGRGRQ